MSEQRARAAASKLATAWREGRTVDDFPEDLAPRDHAEALAVQDRMAAEIGDAVAGWKVAGAPGRPCGRVFASTVFPSGATLPAGRFPPLHLECEVGFRLRAALPPRGRDYTAEEVAAAADLSLNVECVGSRLAGGAIVATDERESRLIVADNAVQAALVTGPIVEDWRDLALLDIEVALRVDGAGPAPAIPLAERTDPLDVLVWLANDLARRGAGLASGQIVTPGSVTAPRPLAPGASAVAEFVGFGAVTLSLAR